MKNLQKTLLISLFAFLPLIASAQTPSSLDDLVELLVRYLNQLIPILVALILLFFLYGVADFIRKSGKGDELVEAKKRLWWGIIAVFVSVSFWGLVTFLTSEFFGDDPDFRAPGINTERISQLFGGDFESTSGDTNDPFSGDVFREPGSSPTPPPVQPANEPDNNPAPEPESEPEEKIEYWYFTYAKFDNLNGQVTDLFDTQNKCIARQNKLQEEMTPTFSSLSCVKKDDNSSSYVIEYTRAANGNIGKLQRPYDSLDECQRRLPIYYSLETNVWKILQECTAKILDSTETETGDPDMAQPPNTPLPGTNDGLVEIRPGLKITTSDKSSLDKFLTRVNNNIDGDDEWTYNNQNIISTNQSSKFVVSGNNIVKIRFGIDSIVGTVPLKTISGISLPPKLISLDLSATDIESVDNLSLPSTLKYLSLSFNGIKSIDSLSLPDSIEEIYLKGNFITNIDNVRLPSSLKILALNLNRIESLSNVNFPNSFEYLDLRGVPVRNLSEVNFPNSIKEIYLNENDAAYVGEIDKLKEKYPNLTVKEKSINNPSYGM